jgi:hypothetical protein
MKTILSLLFIFLGLNLFPQSSCDTLAIEKIINRQMKIADKWFDRPFVLSKSSSPYDSTQIYYQLDSTYNKYCCGRNIEWNDFNLGSKYGKVESETSLYEEYSLFISTPIFNETMDKCRFVINTHFSEWGGQGRLCFYEKKNKKWKLAKSTLLWVS